VFVEIAEQIPDIDPARGLELVPPEQNHLAVRHVDRIVSETVNLVEIDDPTDMAAIKSLAQKTHEIIQLAVISVLPLSRTEQNQPESAFRVENIRGMYRGGFGARQNRNPLGIHRKSSPLPCRTPHTPRKQSPLSRFENYALGNRKTIEVRLWRFNFGRSQN
jgi:hypothetical protein